ncbi:MAG: hydroxymethylbilane synthase [Nitrospirota bacterium]
MKTNKISIGTRGSKLALWQAEWVKSELKKLHPDLGVEIIKIKTTGDKILDVPLAKVGGKGLFVKEIEEALLRHEVDIAVHSMKDVPTEFPEGLCLPVICKREDPRDALIISHKSNPPLPPFSKGGRGEIYDSSKRHLQSLLFSLPRGVAIGTSSLRRSCQLLNIRPDLRIKQLRGNLDTRLRKLDEGQFYAIIVASAGLKRLGLEGRIAELLPFEISLPAIGQGAIGIECRIDDKYTTNLIATLNHPETAICVKAERAFLKKLEGGCQVPIAAYARLVSQDSPPHPILGKGGHRGGVNSEFREPNYKLVMDGLVGNIEGDRIIKGHFEGSPEQAEDLGIILAEDVLTKGAKEILNDIYGREG